MLKVQYEVRYKWVYCNEVIRFAEAVDSTSRRMACPVGTGTLFGRKAITDLICTVFN
jgi:hypothetical protein